MADHPRIKYEEIQTGDYFIIESPSGKTPFVQTDDDTHWEEYADATRPRATRLTDACYLTIRPDRLVTKCSREEVLALM